MSLNIRYLTNGEKTFYVETNSGVTLPERHIYATKDEIPKSIRHYAPDGDPKFVGPDLAAILGVQDIFYPGFPNCERPEYLGKRCIAESCKFAPNGDWTKCPYFSGYETKGENNDAS